MNKVAGSATANTTADVRTPLFDELRRHVQRNPVQFHIPGHKRGVGMDPEFRSFLGDNALAIDQINIDPLDDVHQPHGIIADAQQEAAAVFGADHTFFSVQGTSTAIMTMIMAVCGPGDKIIVPRNVHKSVMSALILAGAVPVFVVPELDPESSFVGNVAVATIERALAEHPDARALFMINPSYYGASANLRAIVELAHARNVPVLVDEAHGAQFYFHPDFPTPAMRAGADAAAVSMHKTGGSLTQSSLLNVQGSRICPQRVQAILSLLTTTSTSYLLLASLDAARRHMQLHGRELLDRALRVADDARRRINEIDGLRCNGVGGPGEELAYAWDRTKLCIDVRGLGLSGRQVEMLLRDDYNIEVELSDLHNILCLVTIADDGSAASQLVDALRSIAAEHRGGARERASSEWGSAARAAARAGTGAIGAAAGGRSGSGAGAGSAAGAEGGAFAGSEDGATIGVETGAGAVPENGSGSATSGVGANPGAATESEAGTSSVVETALGALAVQPAAFSQRPVVHTPTLTPRQAFFAATESLPLDQTVGRITAEFVTIYPPGIPTLVPGEIITEADIDTVRHYQALGYPVHGPEDATVDTLRVVRDVERVRGI